MAERDEHEERGEWTSLFDGETLDGWFSMANPDGWMVDDGCIHCPGKGDELDGSDYLFTEEEYVDFDLELEFLTEPDANSGVFLRTSDPDDPVQTGLEIQILDTHDVDDLGKHAAGALYDLKAPSENAILPAGEWNRLRITCDGPRIREVLNGQEVLDVTIDDWDVPGRNPDGTENKFENARADMPRRGHVGLQDHGDAAWFRDVRIRER